MIDYDSAPGVGDGGQGATITRSTFDGGTAFPTDDYYNVAITSGTHSLAGNCTVAGSFTLSSGAISINSETLDVEGTFNASGGSVTFTGSGRLQLGGSVSSLGTFT